MVIAPRLRLPRAPQIPTPYRFPVIGAVAPVIIALVIWLVTGSAFALLFAAMGPIAALAGWVDSRVSGRRSRARESDRFDRDSEALLNEIGQRHAVELAHLMERYPGAMELVVRRGIDPYRWRTDRASEVVLNVGTGLVPSALEIEPVSESTDLEVTSRWDELVARAAILPNAPITLDARLGLGVVGPNAVARSVARALAVQIVWNLSPREYWWAADDLEECEWLHELPHAQRRPSAPGTLVEFGPAHGVEGAITLAVAPSRELLPRRCRVIIEVSARGAEITHHPDPRARHALRPDVVSRQHARAWARDLSAQASREGALNATASLPESIDLGPMLRDGIASDRGSLDCILAIGLDGLVSLDLVHDGPHAVVGGTTGSGKSELLIAWVVALAASRSPADVTFLLVDFKGGSAFAPLERLPHTVGIVTDLDATGAARALDSLRAEVEFREHLLLREGVRSIDETAELPRLVIVVDEYAAMVGEHPEMHILFSDLAARGRSLGIHLVLCTQRPTGVVRDGVLANIDLRVSLRVNNPSDSSAVLGTDAAAAIPAAARGRAWVRLAGGAPREVQFALAQSDDIDVAVQRWMAAPPVRRPWCEPLGPTVDRDELRPESTGVAFALVDLPREQRRGTAVYDPTQDGHLVVLGASRSGKSNLLALIAQSGVNAVLVPGAIDAAWDVLVSLGERLHHGAGAQQLPDLLVLIDDVDSLASRFTGEYRQVFVELLCTVLRDGPGFGIHVALAAQRLSGDLQPLVSLIPSRVMLRHTSRQDYVIAGAEGAQFVPSLPAGGGHWRGDRIQIARAREHKDPQQAGLEVALSPGLAIALISHQSHLLLRRIPGAVALSDAAADLSARLVPGTVVVGDVDEWQSKWGALNVARAHSEVVFDQCSTADFRALTRSRALPPPLTSGQCWRLGEDGSVSRTRLPW